MSSYPNKRSQFDRGLDFLLATRSPGETFTLQEIAQECGVSRERVRQVEAKALRKLRSNPAKMRAFQELIGTFNELRSELRFER